MTTLDAPAPRAEPPASPASPDSPASSGSLASPGSPASPEPSPDDAPRASAVASGVASGALRSPSRLAGIALAAMAALAPVAVFGALPAGLTGIAALIVLVVAALDVVVALALLPLLSTGGELLARIAAGLRLAYAAGFAVAAGELLGTPDAVRFDAVWNAVLVLFGAHLVTVAIAMFRSPRMPSWIGAFVALAGAGYVADGVVAALAPQTGVEFAAVTFVGEVLLLVWLIWRGGRPARPAREDAPRLRSNS